MKTPMQELIDRLKEERDLHGYERGLHYETAIELAEGMLEKEKDYRQRMIEIVAQELHNLGMPTDKAINQAAFESDYGYSSTNYNSFKEGVKWIIEQFELFNKTFKTKER